MSHAHSTAIDRGTDVSPVSARHSRKASRQRGVAVLMVLVLTAVAAVITSAYLTAQQTTLPVSQNIVSHASARGVAESGLELTIRYIETNGDWRTDQTSGAWTSSLAIAGGNFTVRFTDEVDGDLSDDTADPVIIDVIGTSNGVSHQVSAEVTPGETAKSLLFVVGDDASPTTEDLAKRSLFTSWGFDVTIIDDGDSQANYDIALAESDVAFISGTVTAATLGTKLTGSSVGVVCEAGASIDEFELSSSSSSFTTGTQITVTDAAHPITAGFGTGALTIATLSMDLRTYSNLADGVQTLATASGVASLVVADWGAELDDGSEAVGRRVFLPAKPVDFDPNDLSADGKTLIKNALWWAAANVIAPRDMLVYYPLNTGSGTTAVDATSQSRDGVISGASWSTGKVDGGLDFGASNTLTDDDGEAYLNGLDGITIAGWFKADGTGNDYGIFRGHTATTADSQLTLRYDAAGTYGGGSNVIKAVITTTEGTVHYESASLTQTTDWQHLAFTWRSGQPVQLYINGELDSPTYHGTSSEATTELGGSVTGTDTLQFGRTFPNASSWRGEMDDLRVYGRGVTAADVAAMMRHTTSFATGKPIVLYDFKKRPKTPVLKSHWKLDYLEIDVTDIPLQIATEAYFDFHGASFADSYDSAAGAYGGANISSLAQMATVTTASDKVHLESAARLYGDLFVGFGADPNDVLKGDYSSQVTGSIAALGSTVTVSNPPTPSGFPASIGDVSIITNYTVGATDGTIKATVGKLEVKSGATMTIRGDVELYVTKTFDLDNGYIVLDPDAHLTIYVDDIVTFKNGAKFNADSTRTRDASLYVRNGKDTSMDGGSIFAGEFWSSGKLDMSSASKLYGTMRNKGDFKPHGASELHVDLDMVIGGRLVADEVDVGEGSSSGTIRLASGHHDKSVKFDGSTGRIVVPHDDTYLLDTGSLSFWFYAHDVVGTQGMISKDSSGYDNGGHLTVELDTTTLTAQIQSTTASYTVSHSGIAAGQWYHVVVGWGGDGLRLYVNGVQRSTNAYTGGLGTSSGGTGNKEPWTFGCGQTNSGDLTSTGWDEPYHGRLDDIRIYDQNLSAEQAANLAADLDVGDGFTGVTYDAGGYGTPHNLTPSSQAALTWVTGGLQIGSATTITSATSTDKIRTALIASDAYTAEFVFTPASISSGATHDIFATESGTTSDLLEFDVNDDDTQISLKTSGGSLAQTTADHLTLARQHIVYTFDGTNVTLYQNGVRVTQWAHSGDLSNLPSDITLYLASDANGTDSEFVGTLHRVAIYDAAMEASEVALLYRESEPSDDGGGTGSGIGTYTAVWKEIERD